MMKCETQPFDIEAKVRQDCYNRGYEQGRKNPAEEIVEYIEKLQKQVKEYQDKIEQGTLVELPCKVGDRVYVIADGIWHCQEVWQFRYDSCGLFVKTVGVYPYDFECGKTAFLTREEAEKRLKELQNG